MYKIGNSIDIHPLVKNAPLYIGGVLVKSELGCLSHSDGDALTHSIVEAILGALGKGDLGQRYPTNDHSLDNIRSTEFLKDMKKLLDQEGYVISNIDCMIVLERPSLKEYKDKIKESIASYLDINKDLINIKAGTNEKIGSIGNSEAYLCWTSVLLERK